MTVTTGTTALVIVTAQVDNSNNGQSSFASYAISGATTSAATDQRAVTNEGQSITQASTTTVETGLTAGSNTFTLQYRRTNNTATFSNRTITVIPLG